MDYTPRLNDKTFTLDLEPYIRKATEQFVAEVDRRIAPEVAAALVKLGWVCMTAEDCSARDREVAARAWEEGQRAQFHAIKTRGVTVDIPVNPYRSEPQ